MAAQAVFMDEVHPVRALRYAWAEDGTVLLTLDCHVGDGPPVMTFGDLRRELSALCPWQTGAPVVIGLRHALAEVVTIYHAFEHTSNVEQSLMLVCTPPEEYFEGPACISTPIAA